jgi:hypothetical protein
LADAFLRVKGYAARRGEDVGPVWLNVGCPRVEEDRRSLPGVEGRRAFAHVMHIPGAVCVAREAADLPLPVKLGLLVHEVGHLIGGPGEDDADIAALEALGLRVEYFGPLRLERLHREDVGKVMGW